MYKNICIVILLFLCIQLANSQLCQPWGSDTIAPRPVTCAVFDGFTPGMEVYVDTSVYPSIVDLQNAAETIIGYAFLLPATDNDTVTDLFTFYGFQYQCQGYIRPCWPNDQGLALPQQICRTSCDNLNVWNSEYLIKQGLPLTYTGTSSYQDTFNTPPLNCSGWIDNGLSAAYNQTIFSYSDGSYTVNNITVPCIPEQPYFPIHRRGCDENDGMIADGIVCYGLCPLLPITTESYEADHIMVITLSCISVVGMIIALVVLGIWARHTYFTIPHVIIPLALVTAFMLYAALSAPWIIGYGEVLCNSGPSFAIIAHSDLENELQGVYYVEINGFESHGDSCTAQGFFMYWTLLSLYLYGVLYLMFNMIIVWSLLIDNKVQEDLHWSLRWIFNLSAIDNRFSELGFKQTLKSKGWWKASGIRALKVAILVVIVHGVTFIPALAISASGNIKFKPGSTFCFIDTSETAINVVLWICPILLTTIIGGIFYLATIIPCALHIYRSRFFKSKKMIINSVKLVIIGFFMLVTMALTCSAMLYNSLNSEIKDQEANDFYMCKLVFLKEHCDLAITPSAMAIIQDLTILLWPNSFTLVCIISLIITKYQTVLGNFLGIISRVSSASSESEITKTEMSETSQTVSEVADEIHSYGMSDASSSDEGGSDGEK